AEDVRPRAGPRPARHRRGARPARPRSGGGRLRRLARPGGRADREPAGSAGLGLRRAGAAGVALLQRRQPRPRAGRARGGARLCREGASAGPALLVHRRRVGRRLAAVAAAHPRLGTGPGRARRAAAARPRRAADGPGRPAGPAGAAGRGRPPAAGLHRDVHRGDRRLAARRRRRRALPRPGHRAGDAGPGLRPHRRRPGGLQGRGRRGDGLGVPGAGRLGGPPAARAGPVARRDGRRRRAGPGTGRPRGQPLRQRLQRRGAQGLHPRRLPPGRDLHQRAVL
ncbi:MAG: GCN5-related N-acetyltransferase, FIGfam019367, partial [uncultured Frankineae bacterium]